MEDIVKCRECNTVRSSDLSSKLPSERSSCSNCGSTSLCVKLLLKDTTGFQEIIKGKVKDTNLNSKKNPVYEFVQGNEIHKSTGKYIKKERIIDKKNNKYFEKITNPKNNEIMHLCDEKLTDHFGHGSSKFK